MRELLLAIIGLGIWLACGMGAEYLEKQRMTKHLEAVVRAVKCPS